MNIFVSVGAQYNDEQKAFVTAFDAFLFANGCKKLTVDDSYPDQPVFAARKLMEEADAVVVLAFTRFLVHSAFEKPACPDQKTLKDMRYPTIWNQLESAMGFGLHLPLLVIIEEGLCQEAMLKDRLEYRTVITKLDPQLFSSDAFKGKFRKWMERVRQHEKRGIKNIGTLTIVELFAQLRPDQIWKVGAALVSLLAAVATTAYWLGEHT